MGSGREGWRWIKRKGCFYHGSRLVFRQDDTVLATPLPLQAMKELIGDALDLIDAIKVPLRIDQHDAKPLVPRFPVRPTCGLGLGVADQKLLVKTTYGKPNLVRPVLPPVQEAPALGAEAPQASRRGLVVAQRRGRAGVPNGRNRDRVVMEVQCARTLSALGALTS